MSEHMSVPEQTVEAESDNGAVPMAAVNSDAPQEDAPSRPDGVPEKFWDAAQATVRTEALLKSYLEIERKLGSMIALPTDADDSEGRNRLLRALGVPESPEGYQIESQSALLDPSPEINARLHAAGFTPEQAQLVYDLAADHLLPMVSDVLDTVDRARDTDRLVQRFGGVEAWRALAKQIKSWGSANLSEEVFDTLSKSYDGVVALHQMMQAPEPAVLSDGDAAQVELDEAALSQMMRDPRYWRERDPDLVARVTDGFQRLYQSQ